MKTAPRARAARTTAAVVTPAIRAVRLTSLEPESELASDVGMFVVYVVS
jgi:hypothetical protein